MNREQMEEMLDAYIDAGLATEYANRTDDVNDPEYYRTFQELDYAKENLAAETFGELARDVEIFVRSLSSDESSMAYPGADLCLVCAETMPCLACGSRLKSEGMSGYCRNCLDNCTEGCIRCQEDWAKPGSYFCYACNEFLLIAGRM